MVSWQVMLMLIGMMLGRYKGTMTQVYLWLGMSAHVFSIGLQALLGSTKIYQTTIVVSIQANMQGLQRPKILDNIETRFHVICLWWLSSKDATKEGTFSLSE